MTRWRRLGLAAGAGAFLTLAQPPFGLWPAAFLALPGLVLLLGQCRRPAEAFWTGWAAGAAFFATGLFWIAEAFFVDAARHGWMAPFAVTGLAGGLALFWALPFWLAARLGRVATGALGLAVLWTVAEYARAHVLTGFPWALPAYVWFDTPLAQTAALAGPHALGFLTLAAGGGLAALVSRRVLPALPGLALLAAGWLWGADRLAGAPAPPPDAPVVRLVQPNTPQEEKWREDRALFYFRRQLDLTAAAADRRPVLVIWPETAVPWLLDREAGVRTAIAEAAGVPVIVGTRRVRGEGAERRWTNGLVVVAPDGTVAAAYDKAHLVPFGEYLPFAGLFDALGLTSFTGTGFSPGPGAVLLSVPGLPAIRPLICYEVIFPQEIVAAGRPDLLVNITNDAWFGASAGPWQHLAQARFRAIEQGLPLARAAMTGISAMIDPFGRVTARVPLLEAGFADAPLPPPLPPTFYSRTGDLPWIALLALAGVILVTIRRRKAGRGLTIGCRKS